MDVFLTAKIKYFVIAGIHFPYFFLFDFALNISYLVNTDLFRKSCIFDLTVLNIISYIVNNDWFKKSCMNNWLFYFLQ
jgi:hypothetical protein